MMVFGLTVFMLVFTGLRLLGRLRDLRCTKCRQEDQDE
jgi:hypothetical protein